MLQKRFRSRDGFPPLCKYIIWLEARQERCNLAQNFVISGRSRIEVAITDAAQSRHTRVRYKGFRGDRRPPLSVYIQLWPLCSIQLIICLGSPSPNLFTQLFTQGTRPVFHAGKSLKATHVSSHLEELLSDGRKNHRRKDASKVMHLQSTKCFEQKSWMSRFIFCETRFLLCRKKLICEREKVTFLLLLVPALLLLEARAVLLGASLQWNSVFGLLLTTWYLVFGDWLCESGPRVCSRVRAY